MSTIEKFCEASVSHPSTVQRERPLILVVDDEDLVREILVRKLSSLNYECESCACAERALELAALRAYDLILADIVMDGMSGMALLKALGSEYPDTAVILVTSVADIETAVEALKCGAYDYITKPFRLDGVALGVARALEKRRLLIENRRHQHDLEVLVADRASRLNQALQQLRGTYRSTFVALGTALDSRETDARGHSMRVTLFATRLAEELGIHGPELTVIEQGALLHDIGKLGVPDALLRKPDPLTEADWILMRRHPEIGYRILSGIKFLRQAAALVLQHHERFDGTGYPQGLRGEEISSGARIFAVADILDCVTSHRPFRTAVTFEAARDEIRRVAGSQLDPAVVEAFLDIPLAEWKEIRRRVASGSKVPLEGLELVANPHSWK